MFEFSETPAFVVRDDKGLAVRPRAPVTDLDMEVNGLYSLFREGTYEVPECVDSCTDDVGCGGRGRREEEDVEL